MSLPLPDFHLRKATKTIFEGGSEAKKHGIFAEGKNFLAEAPAKICAGNFCGPEKMGFCSLKLFFR